MEDIATALIKGFRIIGAYGTDKRIYIYLTGFNGAKLALYSSLNLRGMRSIPICHFGSLYRPTQQMNFYAYTARTFHGTDANPI